MLAKGMSMSDPRRLKKQARRAAEIIGVMAKYGLADWLQGWPYTWIREGLRRARRQPVPDLPFEERVRLALTELGPTFIKLGQLLSTRPDLVGPEMAEELSDLLIATPADSIDTVRATLEAELGKTPEALFKAFDAAPIASASIAQVHAAQLTTGERVVVKVQHTGILETITTDLDILDSLAELAEKHLPKVRHYQPVLVMRHFRRTLLQECDFTFERRNVEQFAANFADDSTVHFPQTYPALSATRVLTMERLEGILGTDRAALVASGANLDEVAKCATNMYLQMMIRDSFYHADPHPGNLMLLPGGVVGVLDCGMVGRLDEVTTEGVEDIVRAIINRSSIDLTAVVWRLGSFPRTTSREQLRSDFADLLADYADRPINELNTSGALNRFLEIIQSSAIALPPSLLLLVRTLIELEGTAASGEPALQLDGGNPTVLRRHPPSPAVCPPSTPSRRTRRRGIGDGRWKRCPTTWATS